VKLWSEIKRLLLLRKMMKYFSLVCVLILSLNSCKKEDLVTEKSQQNDSLNSQNSIKKESPSSPEIAIKVEPLEVMVEPGKTVFSQDEKTMFFFDTRSKTGEIKINGKIYILNEMKTSETAYFISGKEVTISAEKGNFEEFTSDCLYGDFPSVKIGLNNHEIMLTNISLQDCPAYSLFKC
jgi:hypothetical protein